MRVGAFPSTDFTFGMPAAVAKPADNNYPLFDSALIALGLSNQDLADLQARAQALYDALRAARDQIGNKTPQQLYSEALAAYNAGTGRNPGSYQTFLDHGMVATGPYKT